MEQLVDSMSNEELAYLSFGKDANIRGGTGILGGLYNTGMTRKYNLPGYAVNDLWTVTYTSQYSIAVWYGYDNLTKEYYNRLNSGQHERLFQAVGKKVFTNGSGWKKPDGVVSVTIEKECAESMLPSQYTPDDYKTTELFIRGTEPTTVSPRFDKLKSVTNVKAEVVDGTITITWDKVETPKVNTEAYLRENYRKVFFDAGYLEGYVKNRVAFINNTLGGFGYMVYVTDTEGNQDNGNFVALNSFTMDADTTGDYTFVIKTSYKSFKANMSDGVSITVTAEAKDPIIPNPDDEEPEDPTNNG